MVTFFGSWIIISESENKGKERVFICECSCGKIRSVYLTHLRSGQSTGCGCEKSRKVKERMTKHGSCNTPEYASWKSMHWRCNNKSKNKDYSGRGIKVCERWSSFENFFEDMGNKPTDNHEIDRIDNNLGYCHNNCKWSTCKQNSRNKTNSFIVESLGVKKCLSELCEENKVKYGMIYYRMKKLGMTFDEALRSVQ